MSVCKDPAMAPGIKALAKETADAIEAMEDEAKASG